MPCLDNIKTNISETCNNLVSSVLSHFDKNNIITVTGLNILTIIILKERNSFDCYTEIMSCLILEGLSHTNNNIILYSSELLRICFNKKISCVTKNCKNILPILFGFLNDKAILDQINMNAACILIEYLDNDPVRYIFEKKYFSSLKNALSKMIDKCSQPDKTSNSKNFSCHFAGLIQICRMFVRAARRHFDANSNFYLQEAYTVYF